jgi:NAD kinase
MAIVVGGDGTMLNAARQLARYRVPLVGVNQGRLGFMTDIARSDMLTCMDDLLDGKFVPETRMLLDAEVVRDERSVVSNLALNDVVVDKGAIGRMIEFELFIDGEFIYHLRSDGLIVATSTGSTAYALSANGPILHPQVSAIALVPLCPHALTNRPILVGDRNEIEIRIVHATDSRAHFDGQVTVDLRTAIAYASVAPNTRSACCIHRLQLFRHAPSEAALERAAQGTLDHSWTTKPIMLCRLTIRDFVLVDRLELEFQPGFGTLTGETGAGKSILVDALAFALGERADASLIRAGCERAEVNAEFDLEGVPAAATGCLRTISIPRAVCCCAEWSTPTVVRAPI